MTCEQIERLLPDYFERNLRNEELGEIERHLEQCPSCKEQVVLWEKLLLLPEEQPSPTLRDRFETMLSAYQEGRWENSSLAAARSSFWPHWLHAGAFRVPVAGVAAALIFLVIGFQTGRHLSPPNSQQPELAAMQNELVSMRQMVALSLLQQQAASERLQGVTWSTRIDRPDPEILSALLHTLRYDSNVDVRLAALDALRRYSSQPEVRTGLVDALQAKQSPLVQIALIDLFVELRDASVVPHLMRFQQQPDLNPAVRQRAQWGVQQLSRG
jgi:hypothetical protein